MAHGNFARRKRFYTILSLLNICLWGYFYRVLFTGSLKFLFSTRGGGAPLH